MRIYFLGIAGTAMGNAALLLRSLGHDILGSDQAVYPPMSDMLQNAGVEIMTGYDAERLKRLAPDLVVVGNAYSRGNDEVEFLLDTRSIPYCSLPEALARFALFSRRNIVVTGTHGKTTTTSLAAYLLDKAGQQPGFLIGGAPIDPPTGYAAGVEGGPFVIEGDEYDSAFFDKRSKFIHYQPRVIILNNLEFDHADIFRDLDDVKRTFSHLLRLAPKSGYVLVNGDDENALSLFPLTWTRVYQVGVSQDCDLRIENYLTTATGSKFDLVWQGKLWQSIEWGMTGLFNARNAAMASLAAALSSGVGSPMDFPLAALKSYRGVARRQTLRKDTERLKVIEDFGHHPTAIRETLVALRQRYPQAKLIAAFEPRSNTSRLEIMREPMTRALGAADEVVIGAAKRRSSERVEIMDTDSLAATLTESGTPATACETNDEALQLLRQITARPSDQLQIVIFFTNGSFGGIIPFLA